MISHILPTSPPPPCWEQLSDRSISHGFHDLQLYAIFLLAWVTYLEVWSMRENAFCLVFHARWISHHSPPNPIFVARWDSEICGEKNPFRTSAIGCNDVDNTMKIGIRVNKLLTYYVLKDKFRFYAYLHVDRHARNCILHCLSLRDGFSRHSCPNPALTFQARARFRHLCQENPISLSKQCNMHFI